MGRRRQELLRQEQTAAVLRRVADKHHSQDRAGLPTRRASCQWVCARRWGGAVIVESESPRRSRRYFGGLH